VSTVCTTGLDY